VEALAAALFITGFGADARTLMARFHWGDSFWQLNGQMLAAYAACPDSAAVLAQQELFMATIQAERAARADQAGEDAMPSSESESSSGSGSGGGSDSGGEGEGSEGKGRRAFRVRNPNAGWRGGGGSDDDEEEEEEEEEEEDGEEEEGEKEARIRLGELKG